MSLRIKQSQIKEAIRVNSEMLRFYFSLGTDIVNKKADINKALFYVKKTLENNFQKEFKGTLPSIEDIENELEI